jgi:hypothetical protein
MRFGGEVDDRVDAAHQVGDDLTIGYVATNEAIPGVVSHRRQIFRVAAVRELVEDHDVVACMSIERIADECRPNEAGSAGDENAHGLGSQW